MHEAVSCDNSPLAIFPTQQAMLCYLEHMNNHDNKLIKNISRCSLETTAHNSQTINIFGTQGGQCPVLKN